MMAWTGGDGYGMEVDRDGAEGGDGDGDGDGDGAGDGEMMAMVLEECCHVTWLLLLLMIR